MAKRSRQSFLKRQRERQRAEKAAEKRQKRLARRSGASLHDGEDSETSAEPSVEEAQAAVDSGSGSEERAPLETGSERAESK
jgi:hypothetical protein